MAPSRGLVGLCLLISDLHQAGGESAIDFTADEIAPDDVFWDKIKSGIGTYLNVSLLRGRRQVSQGDARCWNHHHVREIWRLTNEGDHVIREAPWLVRDICCALGRTGHCWGGDLYSMKRCCPSSMSVHLYSNAEPHGGHCWPSRAVTAACCAVGMTDMCSSPRPDMLNETDQVSILK
ncbi:unnamed protein product, partial [Polarella glacialis]